MATRERTLLAHEGGLQFEVNLSDYLDTGLFLDHRLTRAMVRGLAAGKRFLNLFAYTGAFTVYAAAGGAESTTTVDLSASYLDWARRNMALNGLVGEAHLFVRDDSVEFLEACGRRPCFDLAVVDPPTFSNSKRLDHFWDIQRDHARLLNRVLELMTPGGIVFFSTNFRRFKLAEAEIRGASLVEISRQSVPPEFRNRRIHRCWRGVRGRLTLSSPWLTTTPSASEGTTAFPRRRFGLVCSVGLGNPLFAAADFEDLETQRALGNGDLHPVANLFAHQTLGQGTGHEDLAGVVVLFAGPDQGEFLLVTELQILDDHHQAETHLVGRLLRRIDEYGARELVAEHIDAGFQDSLALACAMIFGVFAQVALGAGGGQTRENFGHFHGVHVIQVGLELVVAGPGHGNLIRHRIFSRKTKKRRPARPALQAARRWFLLFLSAGGDL